MSKRERAMNARKPMLEFEAAVLADNPSAVIAGVDEAGRGPLAGPVVVAAVVIHEPLSFALPVDDSKQLAETVREELGVKLREDPGVSYSIAMRSAEEIDRMNILQATHAAMREAVMALNPLPDMALVDGLPVPRFPVPAQFIVKGDARSVSIAAASILAKTTRDALMRQLDTQYPGYGFAKHKGYGTAEHLEAVRRLGPCPIHRITFAPIRDVIHPPMTQPDLGF